MPWGYMPAHNFIGHTYKVIPIYEPAYRSRLAALRPVHVYTNSLRNIGAHVCTRACMHVRQSLLTVWHVDIHVHTHVYTHETADAYTHSYVRVYARVCYTCPDTCLCISSLARSVLCINMCMDMCVDICLLTLRTCWPWPSDARTYAHAYAYGTHMSAHLSYVYAHACTNMHAAAVQRTRPWSLAVASSTESSSSADPVLDAFCMGHVSTCVRVYLRACAQDAAVVGYQTPTASCRRAKCFWFLDRQLASRGRPLRRHVDRHVGLPRNDGASLFRRDLLGLAPSFSRRHRSFFNCQEHCADE